MNKNAEIAERLKSILGLKREPVGVKLLKETDMSCLKNMYDSVSMTRYCQALMRAGNGENVLITSKNISCPASAAAFGLKLLPEVLATGQMLFNMGLFATPEAGKKAMDGMTRLEQGLYTAVVLSPLYCIEMDPDVVVIESMAEHLMWISLANIFETGERLYYNSAIFQATCVDSTVIPYINQKVNSCLGCYGCRDSTNVEDGEALIGIPFTRMRNILQNLEKLSGKAMKKARAKEAFHSFINR